MKRTHLVLNDQVLEDAKRELGLKTYSATVTYALKEVLRIRRVEGLAEFWGSNLWQGDLAKMRKGRTAVCCGDAGDVGRHAGDFHQFATCGPILQEVLQGLRGGAASAKFEERVRSLPCLSDPLPVGLFLEAAEI